MTLCFSLGMWQLSRAHEKEALLAAHQAKQTQKVSSWVTHPEPYQRMRLTGRYLSTIFFLDNQFHQHQIGYDVISPLRLANGGVVLIDRGFISAERSRTMLPSVTVPEGEVLVLGEAYYPSSKHWVLGSVLEQKTANRMVIELIDTKIFSKVLHNAVYPFIIRLSPEAPHGFIRAWPIVSMPPVRHYGYAVQWFAFAGVILMLLIGLNTRMIST